MRRIDAPEGDIEEYLLTPRLVTRSSSSAPVER
jgi:hypothetical protein